MTSGVVLLAIGKTDYYIMAAYMAMSIKYYNPEIHISIVHDGFSAYYIPRQYQRFIDDHILIEQSDFIKNGKLDPGLAKINLPKYLPYDYNVYLDVDGIALQDLAPLMNATKKFYACEKIGEGKFTDTIEYNIWATSDDIWKYFKLDKEKSVYRTIQTSFVVMRKGKELDAFYKQCLNNYSFPMADVKSIWGKTMPDELIVSGTLAAINHDPDFGMPVVFYPNSYRIKDLAQIQSQFKVLSMYGNGLGTTLVKPMYKEWCDRLITKMCRDLKIEKSFPMSYLMRSKHANRVPQR